MDNTVREMLEILRDAHDAMGSELGDTDLDYFESDEEEREAVPIQYAARRVMEAIDALSSLNTKSEAVTDSPISVKDRLPTHAYSVLGYVTSGPFTAKGSDPLWDIVSYLPERNVWLQNVGDDDVEVSVTYWTELPADPTKNVTRPLIPTADASVPDDVPEKILRSVNTAMNGTPHCTDFRLGECAIVQEICKNVDGAAVYSAAIFIWDKTFNDSAVIARWFSNAGAESVTVSHVLYDEMNGDRDGWTEDGARAFEVIFVMNGRRS